MSSTLNSHVIVSTASLIPTTVALPSTVSLSFSSSGQPVMSTGCISTYTDQTKSPTPSNNLQTTMKIQVSPAVSRREKSAITDLQASVTENKNNCHWLYKKFSEMEKCFNRRINELETQVHLLEAKVFIKDRVSDELLNEINRLEQRNRRPCIIVEGIDKKKGENADDLRSHIENVLEQVETDVSLGDVDKFHRNGPVHDGKRQDIIVRFKTHAAKEKVYRARKKTQNKVRITPSLTRRNKDLLKDSKQFIKDFQYDVSNTNNPPEYVFSNIHGEITLKFKKETKRGMFVTFDTLEQLQFILHMSETNLEEKNDSWDHFV